MVFAAAAVIVALVLAVVVELNAVVVVVDRVVEVAFVIPAGLAAVPLPLPKNSSTVVIVVGWSNPPPPPCRPCLDSTAPYVT